MEWKVDFTGWSLHGKDKNFQTLEVPILVLPDVPCLAGAELVLFCYDSNSYSDLFWICEEKSVDSILMF